MQARQTGVRMKEEAATQRTTHQRTTVRKLLRQLFSAAHDDRERIHALPGEGFSDTSNELRTLEPTN